MEKQLLPTDAVIDIPPEVAVCPYCQTKLKASFTEWEEQDDGTWQGVSPDLECETEPDIDECVARYEEWLESHTDMPYVYLMPVQQKVESWIAERFCFDLVDWDERLDKWNKATESWNNK